MFFLTVLLSLFRFQSSALFRVLRYCSSIQGSIATLKRKNFEKVRRNPFLSRLEFFAGPNFSRNFEPSLNLIPDTPI